MEEFRQYLESSTIHGLAYISLSGKWVAKIFWILVVIAGFTGAGYMIYQSFQDWNESPVKTTIETLPTPALATSQPQCEFPETISTSSHIIHTTDEEFICPGKYYWQIFAQLQIF